MAISFSEEQGFNWKMIIGFIIIIILIVAGAYFLFFAPTPIVESIAPASVRSASELSNIEFAPESVINSDAWRILETYGGQPSIGQVGRVNPFMKY